MEGRFVRTNPNADYVDNIVCISQTSLLIVFSKGTFPEVCGYQLIGVSANTREQIFIPTLFENYVTDVEVDKKYVELALWDTASLEDYDRLRPLAYPDSHVVLISFNIADPDSLNNVLEKVRSQLLDSSVQIFTFRLLQWIIEVNHFCHGVPIILVGLKKDLRRDPQTIGELRKTGKHPVTIKEVG